MSGIRVSLVCIFVLISSALFLLLKINPFRLEQNILKQRRMYLTGARLKIGERVIILFTTLFRQTGYTFKKFLLSVAAALVGGFTAGFLLFNNAALAGLMAVCLGPAPYFYLTVKSARAAREEIEGLENTMSVITNAYAGCDDIIRAVETYVEEKNRYLPVGLRKPTPFDEFVSEIRLINPNIEHGLYRLSAKIKNRYFAEWVKMLILCHHDRRLKFALFPVIKSMNDAKAMQIESDGMMVVFVLLTTAGFLICRHILKIPRLSMKKNLQNLQIQKETAGARLLKTLVLPVVKPVACFIRIGPEKEAKMAAMLRRGRLALTPREYYARAVICAVFTLPLSVLLLVIGAIKVVPVTLIFSVIVYFHFMTDLKDKLKEKKSLIELELPGFVRSILYKLEDMRGDSEKKVVQVDLIQIFEDYLKVSSEVFYYDIAVLIMEMKAKDIETALRNFNERVGLAEVSFLVNALIGLYRGEHQGEALMYLAKDMDIKAKEALRKNLNRLPGKIKLASVPLVAVTLATLLYVIGSHLVKSMGGLF